MVAIGSDHAGYELKSKIIKQLEEWGLAYRDFGTHNEERTDYPIYAQKVAKAVVSGECKKGILICGTGVGISIAANKIDGIRAVVCSEPYSAKLSREHNDTNILAFGSRVIGEELAKMIVKIWLETDYEGGRHQKRVEQIDLLGRGQEL